MKPISEFSLKHLTKAVCGDVSYTPYVKGHELESYFSKYNVTELSGQGFPSRWKYTEDRLRELNGKDALRQIIEETVDPRRFHGLGITVENAVLQINDFLKY